MVEEEEAAAVPPQAVRHQVHEAAARAAAHLAQVHRLDRLDHLVLRAEAQFRQAHPVEQPHQSLSAETMEEAHRHHTVLALQEVV